MTMNSIFPWQQQQWHLLGEARKNNRLPHALLFTGALGLGQMQFAEAFAASLLCSRVTSENTACGVCHHCELVKAKSHPDLFRVMPDQGGQTIKIDQIRSMVNTANETALQGGYKIIIINPATAMNQSAANALLKTLEEATPHTLFILISEQNLRLPQTIKSRCQKIIFQKPEHSVALHWLQALKPDVEWELLLSMAEGAPLQACALLDNGAMILREALYSGLTDLSHGKAHPLQLAAAWQEHDVMMVLTLLLYWLRDMLRLQLTHQDIGLVNHDYRSVFLTLIQKISQQKLLKMVEVAEQRYQQLLNLQNLNRQLLLEELLIHWTSSYVSR